MSRIDLKRGTTLVLECALQSGGEPVDISGWTIECQINGPSGGAVHTFAPQVTDAAAGAYKLVAAPAETAGWPVGSLTTDIKYRDADGRVMKTKTFVINLVADETP